MRSPQFVSARRSLKISRRSFVICLVTVTACGQEPTRAHGVAQPNQAVVALHVFSAATQKNLEVNLRVTAGLAARLGPRDRLLAVSAGAAGEDVGSDAFLMDVGGDSLASAWARLQIGNDECHIRAARETAIWAIAIDLALDEASASTKHLLLRAIAELELADEELENALSPYGTRQHLRAETSKADRVESVLILDAEVLADPARQLVGGVAGSTGGFVPGCYEHEEPFSGLETIDSLTQLPRAELIAGFLGRVRPARIVIVVSRRVVVHRAGSLGCLVGTHGRRERVTRTERVNRDRCERRRRAHRLQTSPGRGITWAARRAPVRVVQSRRLTLP